jgi:hypothetical protein
MTCISLLLLYREHTVLNHGKGKAYLPVKKRYNIMYMSRGAPVPGSSADSHPPFTVELEVSAELSVANKPAAPRLPSEARASGTCKFDPERLMPTHACDGVPVPYRTVIRIPPISISSRS